MEIVRHVLNLTIIETGVINLLSGGPGKGPEWFGSFEEEEKILWKWFNFRHCTRTTVRVITSRRIKRAGHVARMGDRKSVHIISVGKPKGKRPLGKPRRRWKDNIKMDHQEVGSGGMDWIELAQNRDR